MSDCKKKYYNKNKDKIIAKLSEKVKCECGRDVIRTSIYRHKQSAIHNKPIGNIYPRENGSYNCEICYYSIKSKTVYENHLISYKHKYNELKNSKE